MICIRTESEETGGRHAVTYLEQLDAPPPLCDTPILGLHCTMPLLCMLPPVTYPHQWEPSDLPPRSLEPTSRSLPTSWPRLSYKELVYRCLTEIP